MTTRLALVALVSFSFLTALAQSVFGQQVPTNCGPFMGWGWHGWFLSPLMMLATLAAAFAVVVLIARALLSSQGAPPYRPPRGSKQCAEMCVP